MLWKEKGAGSPKLQKGRQSCALSDKDSVPQDPSKPFRVGPAVIIRLCQLFKLSGMSAVMGQVCVRISIKKV